MVLMKAECSDTIEARMRRIQCLGSWGAGRSSKQKIEGAGGNPPFEKNIIQTLVTEFDKGARGSQPYCRCVLLPLGRSYGVMERTSTLSSKAIMLVRIPPESLPFIHQEGYFSYSTYPQYHGFQELGIFVCRNKEYLRKYPPSKDIELLYFHWVVRVC